MRAAGAPRAIDRPPEEIEFYDSALPPLPAGDYVLEVRQEVTLPDHWTSPAPDAYVHTQKLRVAGPHLALQPSDVFSSYPPAGSDADYSQDLPHVVLSRRTLPWEIGLGPHTAEGTPWLALLLLEPAEIHVPAPASAPPTPTGTHAVTLEEYLKPSDKTIRGPTFADPDPSQRWLDENPRTSCKVVDVDAGAFAAVAPRLDELRYLAHVRRVVASGEEIAGGNGDGWYSVVIGNRLPREGRYAAHLVSLEGFVDVLPGVGAPGADKHALRLLSLASWTFTSSGSGADFSRQMARLSVGRLKLPRRLEPHGDHSFVRGALRQGYVGAAYELRSGARTTAWYRGPLLPVQLERNAQPVATNSEEAMLYDEEHGLFDLSYAVAWQTGRLLALADRGVVASLRAWLRQAQTLSQLLLERGRLADAHALLGLPEETGTVAAPGAVRRAAFQHLARTVAPALAPADPSAPAPLGAGLDPSGLAAHRHTLAGVAAPGVVGALAAAGADPSLTLADGAAKS